jgi:TolB-like protein/Flp pilus assembly protein TadD
LLAVAAFIIYKKFFIKNNDAGIDKSIAVLPFVDMSAGKDQEYFSDGLSEELLNLLSKISELKVIGRTSSFSFKGKNEDLRVIGEKLGVAHILEGSVRKQGNQVKINAKLISVENGYQLWSQQFNRSLDDVFAIQEEIALAITQNLKITLLKNEKLEIGKGLTHSKEAYDAYLKGRHFWYPRRLKESEQFFKQAINVDPSFASAYAGLAVTYVLFPFYRFGTPHESMPKAQEAAEKAIQANSALAEPYASLAWKNFIYDWQPDAAKKYFEKALRINPNYSPVHYWYGQYLAYYASDSTMAIAEMRKGLELDPLDPVAHFSLGVTLKQLNKLNEAIQAFKTAIEFNVEYSNAYVNMGYCYLGIGKADDALKAFNKAAQLSNDWAQAVLIYFYVNNRQHGQAKAAFDELLKRSQIEYIPKSSLAIAASFLGQKDLAHELLKKAFEERDTRLVHYKLFTVPLPKDLLKDPRNMKLFEQFKLPDWR